MLEVVIKKILEKLVEPVIGNEKVRPLFSTSIPGVVYDVKLITEGIIKQSQIEIKIIHEDFDEALKIRKAIIKELNFDLKKPSMQVDDIIFRSELSGGGSLFQDDIQIWEISIIFIVKWRLKNE